MTGDLYPQPISYAQPASSSQQQAVSVGQTRPQTLRTAAELPIAHDIDNGSGQGSGYGFFRHAHPFPSPPMSPTARSVSSPRSPCRDPDSDEAAPMLPDQEDPRTGTGTPHDHADLEKPLQQRFQLFGLCVLNCFMVFPNSLIGPLLPKLARDSGISMTSTGFILAMFSIAMFFTGPVITSATKNIRPKLTTIAGCVLLTVCTIAFAFVNRLQGWQFIVISALIRFVQGVGGSAYSCGSSLLILKLFPDHIAVTSGMLEVSASTGYLIGPALGNVLYKRGGFSTPFLGIGLATMLSIIPVSMMSLSSKEMLGGDADADADAETEIVTAMDVIRVRNVVAILILNTLGMSVLGLQELAINPIFTAIGASVDQVAFAFVLNSIVYGLFSGVCGWINVRRPSSAGIVLFLGSLIMGVGLVGFAGSAAILIPETLTMKCLSLSILMVGFAMSQNPVLPVLVTQTQHLGPGYEHALSGVLVSSVGFGEIVGPIVAGLLFDTIGLPLGAGLISVVIGILAAVVYWQLNTSRGSAAAKPNTNDIDLDIEPSRRPVRPYEASQDKAAAVSAAAAGLTTPLLISVTSSTAASSDYEQ